jgi:hypothetical protein
MPLSRSYHHARRCFFNARAASRCRSCHQRLAQSFSRQRH